MTADRFDSWVEAAERPAGGAWRPAVRIGPETQFFYEVDFEAGPSGPQVALRIGHQLVINSDWSSD